MSSFFYYLFTFFEAGLSVFGLRFTYEQPHYTVVATLDKQTEIRAYPARVAVQTAVTPGAGTPGAGENQAFGALFGYITGANAGAAKIAMTTPVAMAPTAPQGAQSNQTVGAKISMTSPVATVPGADGALVMRFFLPADLVRTGAPAPTDPRVHIVTVPAETQAVRRFSGTVTDAAKQRETALLLATLAQSGRTPIGVPVTYQYDPPFTIPFLRRNEVAVAVTP